jgi:hypothetical protein
MARGWDGSPRDPTWIIKNKKRFKPVINGDERRWEGQNLICGFTQAEKTMKRYDCNPGHLFVIGGQGGPRKLPWPPITKQVALARPGAKGLDDQWVASEPVLATPPFYHRPSPFITGQFILGFQRSPWLSLAPRSL